MTVIQTSETLSKDRFVRIAPVRQDLLIIRGFYVSNMRSGGTLRFGKIRLLGNLEKLPEAITPGETKFKTELAVPCARRSLQGTVPMFIISRDVTWSVRC